MLAAVALGIVACWQVFSLTGWERFVESASNVISLERGCYLLVGWIVLKFAHEVGHGLACKRYGAYVREADVTGTDVTHT
jgi:putative peptide zinc metalloprotease protein